MGQAVFVGNGFDVLSAQERARSQPGLTTVIVNTSFNQGRPGAQITYDSSASQRSRHARPAAAVAAA